MQTIWIQMKPHKMWGFIWDPNCLTFRLNIIKKKWVETMNFLKILKETNIWKNYPACKELNMFYFHIIRACSFCHILSICRKHFTQFLHSLKLKTIYEYIHIEKADLGKQNLLLQKLIITFIMKKKVYSDY